MIPFDVSQQLSDRATPVALNQVLIEQFIASFAAPSAEIVLDFDATDIPVHGRQEKCFFHGYYAVDTNHQRSRRRSARPARRGLCAPDRRQPGVWAWALYTFRHHPVMLLGTALLAYSFGLRQGRRCRPYRRHRQRHPQTDAGGQTPGQRRLLLRDRPLRGCHHGRARYCGNDDQTGGAFRFAEGYWRRRQQSRAARGYGVPSFRWKPLTPSGPAFNSRSMSGYVTSSPAVRSPITRKMASFCVRFRK